MLTTSAKQAAGVIASRMLDLENPTDIDIMDALQGSTFNSDSVCEGWDIRIWIQQVRFEMSMLAMPPAPGFFSESLAKRESEQADFINWITG